LKPFIGKGFKSSKEALKVSKALKASGGDIAQKKP